VSTRPRPGDAGYAQWEDARVFAFSEGWNAGFSGAIPDLSRVEDEHFDEFLRGHTTGEVLRFYQAAIDRAEHEAAGGEA
jgi:hypothetical protein